MFKTISFPPGYKLENTDMVTVIVNAVIDEDGNVIQPFVEIPVYPAFDDIALSVLKRSPKWIPAISHNRKVRQYIRQPVTFVQQ